MTWTPQAEQIVSRLWGKVESDAIAKAIADADLGHFSKRAISAKGRRMGLADRSKVQKVRQRRTSSISHRVCQWIEKERPPFRYAPKCGKPVHGQTSWCEDHCKRVFGSPNWRHEG